MEEVTLTQEQLEALTEGGATGCVGGGGAGVYYTYLTGNSGEDESAAEAVGGGAVVVGGGGSADELEGEAEDDGESQQQQQQILINQAEGQEVFVLDQETGEYQRCIYVQQQEEEDQEEEEPLETAVVVGGGDDIDGAGIDPAASEFDEPPPEVSLQSLLETGAISAEDFAAAVNAASADGRGQIIGEDGQVVRYVLEQEQQIKEEPQASPTSKLTITSPDKKKVPGENRQTLHSQRIVVQCGKCSRTFDAEEFEKHWEQVHSDGDNFEAASGSSGGTKTCSICDKRLTRRDYLTHFKEKHSDVRLGCPKCPQTYHSPEFLNEHYRHLHLKDIETDENIEVVQPDSVDNEGNACTQQLENGGRTTLRNVRLLIKCRVCEVLVTNLNQHMLQRHPAAPVTREQLEQLGQSRRVGPSEGTTADSEDLSAVGSAGPAGSAPRVKLYSLHCQVCLKSFRTQRDFANHRRRKDFCVPPKRPAPPDGAAPPAPPKVKRRIGIIRRSL